MAYVGNVGDTFRIKDSAVNTTWYVIITPCNDDGKVVVVNFVNPIKSIQIYVRLTPKDDGRLFRVDKTVPYSDAQFRDHKKLMAEINANQNMIGPECPLDIVNKVVDGAFRARQSKKIILKELIKCYPDIAKQYPNLCNMIN